MVKNDREKTTFIIETKNIDKYFGSVTALEQVDLTLGCGEVLGVVGDNGAGKSTLMKVLAGLYKPSKGEIHFEGKKVEFHSPKQARNCGIEMVYQNLELANNLSIAENIYLGREPQKLYLGGLVRIYDKEKAISLGKNIWII